MRVQSVVPWLLRSTLGGSSVAGNGAVREGFDAAARLLGFAEPRVDREPGALTLRLGAPGDTALAVIDRRGDGTRTYRLDAESDDLAERLSAIRGGRTGVKAKILIDPASCFMRTLILPSAALPRMRGVLAQEMEAATPFRPAAVYSDWYVEGEDVAARSLRVRHVILKRARLDPLLATLARAGLAAGPVTVGQDEERSIPVDLLSDGRRAFSVMALGYGAGDIGLIAGALLLLLGAVLGFRQHQEATLAALDDAFVAARRAAGPARAPALQGGIAAILAERGPPLARTWDALATALPDGASAQGLRLDAEGVLVDLATVDEAAALEALGWVPGFGTPVLRDSTAAADGGRRLGVFLPRSDKGVRP